MIKYLDYNETMALAENFMQKSGIAKFCREVCKGGCCYSCKNACHKGGERRLECTVFICGRLLQDAGEGVRQKWIDVKQQIFCEMYKHTNKKFYFMPPSDKLKRKFQIQENIVTHFFNDVNAVKMYKTVQSLKKPPTYHEEGEYHEYE